VNIKSIEEVKKLRKEQRIKLEQESIDYAIEAIINGNSATIELSNEVVSEFTQIGYVISKVGFTKPGRGIYKISLPEEVE